jgi:hypothetical protein
MHATYMISVELKEKYFKRRLQLTCVETPVTQLTGSPFAQLHYQRVLMRGHSGSYMQVSSM